VTTADSATQGAGPRWNAFQLSRYLQWRQRQAQRGAAAAPLGDAAAAPRGRLCLLRGVRSTAYHAVRVKAHRSYFVASDAGDAAGKRSCLEEACCEALHTHVMQMTVACGIVSGLHADLRHAGSVHRRQCLRHAHTRSRNKQ